MHMLQVCTLCHRHVQSYEFSQIERMELARIQAYCTACSLQVRDPAAARCACAVV
jgi:hypothetical protein